MVILERTNDNSVSLNKYISSFGKHSRREADALIMEGKVTISGKKASLGNRVFEGDHVKIGKKLLHRQSHIIYIAFNKPVGIVCTTDQREPNNIISYINHKQRLFPIGRIDKLSQGLIFLTNDGDIVNKILRVGNAHDKEYIVRVNKPLTDKFLSKMGSGVPILGTVTKACPVTQIDDNTFKIVLVQGLNRQIRRMCEHLGYKVKKLNRTRIMNVSLARLKDGEYRHLTYEEITSIKKSISSSSNTETVTEEVKLRRKSPKNRINLVNKKSKAARQKTKTASGKSRRTPTTASNRSKKKTSYASFKKKGKKR